MDYKKILRLRGRTSELNILHDKHPDDASVIGEHQKKPTTLITTKIVTSANNYMLFNAVNKIIKNSNNLNSNSSENDNVNNTDTENNIDNSDLCYNCKLRQRSHLMKNC